MENSIKFPGFFLKHQKPKVVNGRKIFKLSPSFLSEKEGVKMR
jgi:hypothetical protein